MQENRERGGNQTAVVSCETFSLWRDSDQAVQCVTGRLQRGRVIEVDSAESPSRKLS